jgi:hypothetical protein
VRERTTSVFFFGIRPSVGKIAQLALALLQLGKDAVGARVAPQLHRRPDAGERVVHGRLFEPGQASVARRASAELPLAMNAGVSARAAAAPAMDDQEQRRSGRPALLPSRGYGSRGTDGTSVEEQVETDASDADPAE